MSWSAPRTYIAGEIITASILNSAVRDNLLYLKGVGQVPAIQSGLTIDNSLGSERLLLPLLSTAECSTVLNAEGEVAHDELTHQTKLYDGTAVRALISEADVDDTPVNGATTVPVSSNWAYDFINTLTTEADIPYATAAGVWARLAKGTAGQFLKMNGGATAPAWGAGTSQFFVPVQFGFGGVATLLGTYYIYQINGVGDYTASNFRIPNDFSSLTSVKALIIPITTGTFDWTVTTNFAANGQAYQTHTDSATADAQAATNFQMLELDISAAFTGLAAGDIVGLTFTLDALTTTSALSMLGFDVQYT